MNIPLMEYYRELNSYTYDKISELSGIPIETVQKIFSGQVKEPDKETLQALEWVLKPEGHSVDYQKESSGDSVSMVREAGVIYGAEKRLYTLDDYYALPADQRAELIDGVIYDMGAPSLAHQAASAEIFSQIREFIAASNEPSGYLLTFGDCREGQIPRPLGYLTVGKNGKCRIFYAPVDVQLDCDDKTMVQPDILIICDKEKTMDGRIVGAPDLIIEILSESTRRKDMFLKLHKYESAGVREYWMVDIEKRRVIVYFFEQDSCPVIYSMDDEIPAGIFGNELLIDFARVTEELEGVE